MRLAGDLPAPEEVQLLSPDGISLRAWYYPTGNQAAVIAIGGLGGALGRNLPPVEPLLRAGYGVLQLDSRACTSPPADVTLGYQEAGDAAAALEFLLSRPEIDSNRIGIIGFSMGGVGAIRSAARRPEIAAVIAEGGYYNLGKDIVESDRPKPLAMRIFLYTVAGIFWGQTGVNPWRSSPIDDLPAISPRPILLIYGEFESDDGRALAQFEAADPPKQLWLVSGGDHGTNYDLDPEQYGQKILEFFNKALLQH